MQWVEQNSTNWIYINESNGRIMGRIMSTGAKQDTFYALVNSAMIGEYISLEHAKIAIENSAYLNQRESPIPGIRI